MTRRQSVIGLLACALLAAGVLIGVGRFFVRPTVTVWSRGQFAVSGRDVDVFTVSAKQLHLYWKDATGKVYANGRALEDDLARQGQKLRLALNSGIFQEAPAGLRPLGLHIEQGKELVPLNTRAEGTGNFYLQPNGVLWWNDSRAQILPTDEYARLLDNVEARPHPDFALQSGPLLLVGGSINPAFSKTSENRNLRAGVGISGSGEILLAVASKPVTLFEFARTFERLGCLDALYLDGATISLYAPESRTDFRHGDMAGILAVVAD